MAFPVGIFTGEAAGCPLPHPCCSDRDLSLRPLFPPCKPPHPKHPGKQLPPVLGPSSFAILSVLASVATGATSGQTAPARLQSAGQLWPLEGDASPGHGKPLEL